MMDELHSWLLANIGLVVALLLVVLAVLVFLLAATAGRVKNLSKNFQTLTKGKNDASLEQILFSYAEQVGLIEEKLHFLEDTVNQIEQTIKEKMGTAGIVRYNAFEDGGSDLSFSIAFLNQHKNGVVLTSLYGREDSRVYAKPIRAGVSPYPLTEEENQAIGLAGYEQSNLTRSAK